MTSAMNYSHHWESYIYNLLNCETLPYDEDATDKQLNAWTKRRDECCERIDNEAPPDGIHCPLVWDTWDCWNWTEPGTELEQTCPWWIPQSNPSRNAVKICTADGQWYEHPETNDSWTNYTNCQYSQSTIHVAIFYTGYSISVLSLCFALFIFTYFQSLGCPRVTIHKNLFISFILSGISNITWHITIIIASSIRDSETPCRIAFIMAQFFVLCNYFWMLSEGLYLHTVIVVAVFSENHNLFFYYIVGWVLPLVPAGVLLTLLLTHGGGTCWSEAQEIEWVIGGTIIAVLLTNAGLLLNIVRVLVTKLRATPSQGARTYVRAVRATIILLPLMGLHYIIIPVRPKNNAVAEIIYDCLIAFLFSFQGLFVACIFCFFNGEVINKLHRSIRNFTLVHYSHNANLHNAHGTDGPSETQVSLRCRLGQNADQKKMAVELAVQKKW
ncbi:Calcitonin gene-related peptide type 1 receptor [Holothuria leucospilota]|uniref:Calcitonin gene-related peptide type 1 receptor n=1 Tax=Holothuria leucospilota TaxID=206669 RepID=A0A9Q1BFT7_HOLLE|nr:Calcitonin gene-related peptide type 1 receptor [Holothuria leucospilota]